MGKDVMETSESPKGAGDAETSIRVDGATSVAVEQAGLPGATDKAKFVEGAEEAGKCVEKESHFCQ